MMEQTQQPSPSTDPQMRSFPAVTPSTMGYGGNNGRNTSARASRGSRPSSCSSRRSNNSNGSPEEQRHTPRQLLVSPVSNSQPSPTGRDEGNGTPQKQQLHTEGNQQQGETLYFNLPASLLPHWFALMICSSLSLAAVAAGTPTTTSSSTVNSGASHYEDLQMTMAITTLCVMLTFAAVASYILIPASFVGTLYEVTVVRIST